MDTSTGQNSEDRDMGDFLAEVLLYKPDSSQRQMRGTRLLVRWSPSRASALRSGPTRTDSRNCWTAGEWQGHRTTSRRASGSIFALEALPCVGDTTFVSWRQELTNVKPPVCSKATSTSGVLSVTWCLRTKVSKRIPACSSERSSAPALT